MRNTDCNRNRSPSATPTSNNYCDYNDSFPINYKIFAFCKWLFDFRHFENSSKALNSQ